MGMPREAMLLAKGGPGEGFSVSLGQGMLTIGRGALCDIVLEDNGVSRQHAGIRGDPDGFWIADLGSRNGTYVNSEVIGLEPRRLRNNDRIEFGGTMTPLSWVFMESQMTVAVTRPPLSGS